MLRIVGLVAVGVAAAACTVTAGPDGASDVEFTYSPLDHGRPVEPEPVVSGDRRRLVVTSELSTPYPCYELEAELDRDGVRPTLHVRALSRGGACIAVIGTFRYTAVLHGLPASAQEVRIIHSYPDTGWETRTFVRPVPGAS